MTSTPTFLQRALAETVDKVTGGRRKTLIAIFQRGAVDGLNVVVPYGEHSYYDLRPNIAIPKPDGGAESVINLDGYFGLHPSLQSFKPLWDSKRLAIVHASGSPDSTRSHFDAQDYMESATPGVKSTLDGWLNRYLQSKADPQKSLFRAVSMTQNMPRAMQGKARRWRFRTWQISAFAPARAPRRCKVALKRCTINGERCSAWPGKETFEAVNYLKKVNPAQYKAENGAIYPRTPFGNALLQIAH